MKINTGKVKINNNSNNVKVKKAIDPELVERFDKECLFSSAELKTKHFDIKIDCATYDDTQWNFPINSIYEIIRDKGYSNVVMVVPAFVVAERETSYAPSIYCDGSDFISDVGFGFIDYARSVVPFKTVDEAKESIGEIVGSNLIYERQTDRSLMDLSELTIPMFIALDGKKCNYNPMKRSILVLTDKEFGYTKENGSEVAQDILDCIVKQDVDYLKEWVVAAWENAHCCYLATEALKKQGLEFKTEIEKDLDSYFDKISNYMDENLNAESFFVGDDRFRHIFNGDHRAPDKTPVKAYVDKNYKLDDLVEARYIAKKKPSVYNYYGMETRPYFDPYEHYKLVIEGDRKDIQNIEHPVGDKFRISDFTKEKFAKLFEEYDYWVTISFAVPTPEDVKLFQYPDKYMNYVDYKAKKLEAINNKKPIEESRDELLEMLAKLEPKNDSEIMLKAQVFPSYDKLFAEYAWSHPEVLESNDNQMTGLLGESMYDLCMESKDEAPEHPPLPPQLIPKYFS